jgi:hypothetical protein
MIINLTEQQEKLLVAIAKKRNTTVESIVTSESVKTVIQNEMNWFVMAKIQSGDEIPETLVTEFVAKYSTSAAPSI